MIRIKRVYERPEKTDGFRILVDRIWPRGMTKEKAKIDLWLKNVSPTSDLRKWFKHEPSRWIEFKRRYFLKLKGEKDVEKILKRSKNGKVTLLYSAKNEKFNNAVALAEYVKKRA